MLYNLPVIYHMWGKVLLVGFVILTGLTVISVRMFPSLFIDLNKQQLNTNTLRKGHDEQNM